MPNRQHSTRTEKKSRRRGAPARRADAPPRSRQTQIRTRSKRRTLQRKTDLPTKIRVSLCSANYAEMVARIHKAAYGNDHFSSCLPHDALTKFYGGHIIDNDFSLIARVNGDAAGFIIAGNGSGAATDSFVQRNRKLILTTLIRNPRFLAEKIQSVVHSRLHGKKKNTNVTLRLLSIAVDPKHQRQGIASALIGNLERRLQANGVDEYGLSVRATNTRAFTMYERGGFEPETQVNGTIYMKKTLAISSVLESNIA